MEVTQPHSGPPDAPALYAMLEQLSSAGSLNEITSVVSRAVRVLLQADGATFVLRDGDSCYYAEEDAISPLWRGRRFPMTACISGWSMTNRRPVVIPDIYLDPRVPTDAYRPTFVRSLAMAPVGRNKPVAVLGAYWAEEHEAGPGEVELLQAVADAAALALARVRPQPAGSTKAAPIAAPSLSIAAWSVRALFASVRGDQLRAYGFATACVAIATLVRLAVQATGVHGLVIYSTYYPAVVLAMLVGGRRAGVFATLLGGFAAYYFFMPALYEFVPLMVADFLNLGLYVSSCAMIILAFGWYQDAVLRLRQEDARHLTLAREERHRAGNQAVVVEGIVRQSLRDLPERANTVIRRVWASQGRDARRVGEPTRVRDQLLLELQPYDLARFDFDVDDKTIISAEASGILSLAVHELATNALKHGALSVPEGRVAVAWRRLTGRMMLTWREAGGPPVRAPKRRGFGTTLLRRLVEGAGGSLEIAYPTAGVEVSLSFDTTKV